MIGVRIGAKTAPRVVSLVRAISDSTAVRTQKRGKASSRCGIFDDLPRNLGHQIRSIRILLALVRGNWLKGDKRFRESTNLSFTIYIMQDKISKNTRSTDR